MIIVAGVTRSGLTVMMQMLNAGGYPCEGDYPGFEPHNIGCIPWEECRGKAVKLVDAHLQIPPEGLDYRIIRLKRDLKQQAKSMVKMMKAMGLSGANRSVIPKIIKSLKKDYAVIDAWAKKHDTLTVRFETIIKNPNLAAKKVSSWAGGELDTLKMADCVIKRKPQCYKGFLEVSMI